MLNVFIQHSFILNVFMPYMWTCIFWPLGGSRISLLTRHLHIHFKVVIVIHLESCFCPSGDLSFLLANFVFCLFKLFQVAINSWGKYLHHYVHQLVVSVYRLVRMSCTVEFFFSDNSSLLHPQMTLKIAIVHRNNEPVILKPQPREPQALQLMAGLSQEWLERLERHRKFSEYDLDPVPVINSRVIAAIQHHENPQVLSPDCVLKRGHKASATLLIYFRSLKQPWNGYNSLKWSIHLKRWCVCSNLAWQLK